VIRVVMRPNATVEAVGEYFKQLSWKTVYQAHGHEDGGLVLIMVDEPAGAWRIISHDEFIESFEEVKP